MRCTILSICAVASFAWLVTIAAAAARLDFVKTKSKLPVDPASRLAAVYDDQDTIYIMGGFRARAWSFTLSSGVVEDIGPFVGLAGTSAVMTKAGEILFFGGDTSTKASSAIYSYTPGSRSWPIVGNMTKELKQVTLAWDSASEVAYIFGGYRNDRTDTVLRYDHASKQMTRLGNMTNDGIYNAGAVWVPSKGEAYIFGGRGGGAEYENAVHKFSNLGARNVTQIPEPLPQTTDGPCAVLVGTDQIYVMGVYNLMKFDVNTQQSEIVEVADEYPVHARDQTCIYIAKLGRIYIFGAYFSGIVSGNRGSISYIDLGTVPSTTPTPTNPMTTTTASSTGPTTAPPPARPPQDCSDGTTKMIPDPFCCDTFLYCNAGLQKKYPCPQNQQFNPATAKCEASTIVKCGVTYG